MFVRVKMFYVRVLIFVALVGHVCNSQRLINIESRTYAIDSRTKTMSGNLNRMSNILDDISGDTEETAETCGNGFDRVMDSLEKLHRAVASIKDAGGRNADILTRISLGRNATLEVSVSRAFVECMDEMNFDMGNNGGKMYCLRTALWQWVPDPDTVTDPDPTTPSVTPDDNDRKLDEIYMDRNDRENPPTGFRMRKEYRELSDNEREAFHEALRRVEKKGIVSQFAMLHTENFDAIHGGNAFLPWHRVFITFFEEALRREDRSVALPYWDSTIEESMDIHPLSSNIFRDDFMGISFAKPSGDTRTAEGPVVSGPAADWKVPLRRGGMGPLTRDARDGDMNDLINKQEIDNLYVIPGTGERQCFLDAFGNSLETVHDGPHRFIGGTMGTGISPFDPFFYMHHAFIDKLWQDFRVHQRRNCNKDPTTDYPPDVEKPSHNPDRIMAAMAYLINEDGIQAYWADNSWYNYAPSPHCPSCGRSPYLYCDRTKNVCKPCIRFTFLDTLQDMQLVRIRAERVQAIARDRYGKRYKHLNGREDCNEYPFYDHCGRKELFEIASKQSEIAKRMCGGLLPFTKDASAIQSQLNREYKWGVRWAPTNIPQVFDAMPDYSDRSSRNYRTARSIVYDLLTASQYGYDIRSCSRNPPINTTTTTTPLYSSPTEPIHTTSTETEYTTNTEPIHTTSTATEYTTTTEPIHTTSTETEYTTTTEPIHTTSTETEYTTTPEPIHTTSTETEYTTTPEPIHTTSTETEYTTTPEPIHTTSTKTEYTTTTEPTHTTSTETKYTTNTEPIHTTSTETEYTTTPEPIHTTSTKTEYTTTTEPIHTTSTETEYTTTPEPIHTTSTETEYTTTPEPIHTTSTETEYTTTPEPIHTTYTKTEYTTTTELTHTTSTETKYTTNTEPIHTTSTETEYTTTPVPIHTTSTKTEYTTTTEPIHTTSTETEYTTTTEPIHTTSTETKYTTNTEPIHTTSTETEYTTNTEPIHTTSTETEYTRSYFSSSASSYNPSTSKYRWWKY